MGNLEIDLSKYGCTCFNQDDGGFLDFEDDVKNKNKFFIETILSDDNTIKNKNNDNSALYATKEDEILSDRTNNKKYETIKLIPKNIDNEEKILNKKSFEKIKDNSFLINNNNYLKEFEYSESEINMTNINESKTKSKKEEDEDIDNFNLNTDYYQLAHQISESINELKKSIKINANNNFDTLIKKVDKAADIICFNDIIGCIKKISDINSEINLINEKIYLGLVNKFNKKYNFTHFINYIDEEKIVEIPNFKLINFHAKKKLGKYNNPKFKFNKFSIKGSFPNEILIWKLISKNMDSIKNIIKDNYYCCAVLLNKGRNNENNETIIYFINKI